VPQKTLSYYDENDELVTVSLPATWEDCHFCYGSGSTLAGGLSGAVFTAEDRYDDPDFFEDLARGVYNVPCKDCNGSGAAKVYDFEKIDESLIEIIVAQERRHHGDLYERCEDAPCCGCC